jgi:hypothetical protein
MSALLANWPREREKKKERKRELERVKDVVVAKRQR